MVNFEDSKYKTKNDIINAVDEDGKQVFSKDEKSLFIDYSIKSVKDAKEVAKLILKSKEARKKKKEDDDLKKYLEGERFKNSLAYQIVNKKDEMVDEAINWLKLLIVTDDSPKSKDERKKRRDEIILEIKKKEKEQGEIGRKIAGFKSEKRKKVLEKQREEKSLSRREGLMTLLDAANKKDTDEITNKNGEKILLNKNIEINDYSYIDNGWNGISPNNTVNHVLKKSDDISIPKSTKTVKEWVGVANSFLENIINEKWKADTRTYRHTNLKYNMGREWNCKHNLQCVENSMGYSYLCVLRRIGDNKLIKIIEEKNPSNKEDLKKFVERYFGEGDECSISPWEEKFGRTWQNPEGEGSAERQLEKERAWFKTILSGGEDSYPYVDVPDFKKLFEFMYTIFPVNGTTRKLLPQDYLDKTDSPLFLEAKLGEWKDDWDEDELELFVDGHKSKPPVKSASDKDKKDHLNDYMADKTTKILPGTSFKDLTQMWWDEFSPFLDDATQYWSDTNPEADYSNKSTLKELTDEDVWRANFLEQIRYARTMRELAFKIGLSDEIDEFDGYILDIADEADDIRTAKHLKKSLTDNKDEILKISDTNDFGGQNDKFGLVFYNYRKALLEENLLSNKSKLDEIILAVKLNEDARGEVAFLEAEIKRIDDEINKLSTDELNLKLAIKSLRMEEEALKDDDEFEEEDLLGKIKKFDELYGKKSGQDGKWTWRQLRTLQTRLAVIKKEMNDDARFKREEFEKKQKEVEEIVRKVNEGGFNTIINQDWLAIKAKKGGSLVEAIKEVDKIKDETGISWKIIADAFKGLADYVKLEDEQQNDWSELNKAIAEPDKYKDKPTPQTKITKEALATILGLDVDDKLLVKWDKAIDGKTLSKEDIEEIFNNYAPTKTKHGALISHLREKGVEDGNKITDDKEEEVWKKFLTDNDATKVIKTIVAHEYEDALKGPFDENNAIVKEMRKSEAHYDEDDTKNKFDKDRYGNPKTCEDIDRKKAIQFLFDKKIKNIKQGSVWKEDSNSGGEGEKNTSWFKFGNGNWRPYVTYIGGALVLIAIVMAIFWKQISEWWNGPAEEEGQGKEDDEDEKKDEDE